MTTKTTKTMNGIETTFTWNDGFWVQQEGGTLTEYYDEDKCRLLLGRLNRGAEMMAFGIKKTNGDTMYQPNPFTKIRMLTYEVDGKKYSQHTRKNDPKGCDSYFIMDYKTKMWVQKTGDNIGNLTDNDELQLIKALAKASKYEYEVNGVKNRRGR